MLIALLLMLIALLSMLIGLLVCYSVVCWLAYPTAVTAHELFSVVFLTEQWQTQRLLLVTMIQRPIRLGRQNQMILGGSMVTGQTFRTKIRCNASYVGRISVEE